MSKAPKIQEKLNLISKLLSLQPLFNNNVYAPVGKYPSTQIRTLNQISEHMRKIYATSTHDNELLINKTILVNLNKLFSLYINTLTSIVSQLDMGYIVDNFDVTIIYNHPDYNPIAASIHNKYIYMFILYKLLIDWNAKESDVILSKDYAVYVMEQVVRYLQNRNSSDSINNNTSNENNIDDIEYVKSKLLNGLFGNNNNNNPITPSKIINNNIWINPPYTSEKIQNVLNTVKNKTSN